MSKHRKEKDYLDPTTNHVIADNAQHEPLDFMERIHQVNRLCPGQSKQDINYLLRTYDYNVNETVRRINEEGAKELIGEWSKSTSKKSRKKKKNEPTAAQKEQSGGAQVPSSKPLNNLEPRPASDWRASKPSNPIPPKPPTAPQLPTNSYHSVPPPLDALPNSHLQPIHSFYPDSLHVQRTAPPQRVSPNLSLGTSSNIQFLLLQLQTQTSQLSQWQDMLHQRMDNSLQILQFVFQQLQSSLAERHQLLFSNIESGKSQAHEIFEQRKKLAQTLVAQAKKAPSEEVAESIKRFLADKQCDQQLADVHTLEIEHEAVLSAVLSLGDIVNSIPVYFNWSPGPGPDSAPPQAPAVHAQPLPHPVPSKAPPKQAQPVCTVPDTQPLAQSYPPPPPSEQTHPVYSEPDPAPPAETFLEPEPVPEPPVVTSRVVTLKDPYSSEAKTVDLRTVQKTSKEDLEAARLRMQEMLNKQGRNMIVSDAGGRAVSGPGRRGGDRDMRGGRGTGGNRGRGDGKRGPPAGRYQEEEGIKSDSTNWDGSRDNGHVWSTEFTPSNQAEPDETWDSSQYVESLELTNNNFSDGENDAIAYNPITSVTSAEFKSSQHDSSPDEPPTHFIKPFISPKSTSPKILSPEKPATAINWDNSPADPATNWSYDDGDW